MITMYRVLKWPEQRGHDSLTLNSNIIRWRASIPTRGSFWLAKMVLPYSYWKKNSLLENEVVLTALLFRPTGALVYISDTVFIWNRAGGSLVSRWEQYSAWVIEGEVRTPRHKLWSARMVSSSGQSGLWTVRAVGSCLLDRVTESHPLSLPHDTAARQSYNLSPHPKHAGTTTHTYSHSRWLNQSCTNENGQSK